MPLMVIVVSRPAPSPAQGQAGPCRARESPFPGRDSGGSSQFPVLPLSQAVPGRCPAFPGEGSRASLSSGGCCQTPEPQAVAKGKEAKQDLERMGCNPLVIPPNEGTGISAGGNVEFPAGESGCWCWDGAVGWLCG